MTRSPLRLALLLWLAGLSGVIAMTTLVLPRLLTELPKLTGAAPPPVPVSLLAAVSLVQSAFMLALTVWAGVGLAHRTGLHAPMFEALASREGRAADALRQQLVPGLAGGIAGAAVLVAFARFSPAALRAAAATFDLPLVVRVLYGGVTEEILVRWGVMSLLAWLLAKALRPSAAAMWLAIAISALLFAAGHLPIASLLVGELTAEIVAYVLVANSLFGIVAGYLYWRRGLEAAIVAHVLAHVGAYLVT